GVGNAAASDVVGGTVRGRGDRHRQSAKHRHAAFESQKLERDLALVVVHAEHRVELAASRRDPDGIGREGALDRMAVLPALLDRRGDDVDLLAAEYAALARMRIEPRNRNS